MQDNFRKLPEYCNFLFDTILKKCLIDESFVNDYLYFLVSFKSSIKTNINDHINDFIKEILFLMHKNVSLQKNDQCKITSFIKDVSQYYNIGIILANLFIINKNENNLLDNAIFINFTEGIMYEKISLCLQHINSFLEWLPSDMYDLNGRIYLIFGILETLKNKLLDIMPENDKVLLNDILNLIYNINNIPNKIKFKVLDIQYMIKLYEKKNKSLLNTFTKKLNYNPIDAMVNNFIDDNIYAEASASADANSDSNSFTKINTQTEKKLDSKNIYKPHSYSSLKLVQMQNLKNTEEPIKKETIDKESNDQLTVEKELVKQELVKQEPVKQEPVKQEPVKQEPVKQDYKIYNAKQNYRPKYKEQKYNNVKSNTNTNNDYTNEISNENIHSDGFIKVERKNKNFVKNSNTTTNNNNTNNYGNKNK